MPPKSKNYPKILIALIIILAVAAGIVWYLYLSQPQKTDVRHDPLPEGYDFIAAQKGEYPEGFPKELVIFKEAEIIRGENTLDGTGNRQIIVEFITPTPRMEVLNAYQSKIASLGWQVDTILTQDSLNVLAFAKENLSLEVIIFARNSTSTQVSLNVRGAQ